MRATRAWAAWKQSSEKVAGTGSSNEGFDHQTESGGDESRRRPTSDGGGDTRAEHEEGRATRLPAESFRLSLPCLTSTILSWEVTLQLQPERIRQTETSTEPCVRGECPDRLDRHELARVA